MGNGMVRAVVAATKKGDHVIVVKQPDSSKVEVECTICHESRALKFPADIPKFSRFLNKMEKDHAKCPKKAQAKES